MNGKFEQFCKERLYLKNVSPRTIEWHEQSLKWLGVETPTEDDLKSLVLKMREAGLKASSVNSRLRSINAYLKWSGSSLKVPKLKEPQKVLATYSPSDIKRFLQMKPKTFYERRLQCLLLLLFDTGCRISEALALCWTDVDFDNLLLLVHGKGNRERRIPYSIELRKFLWRFKHEHQRVFCSKQGSELSKRNVLRDVKILCEELGIKCPERSLHATRHTFATTWIQRNGSVATLQRILGHSNIATTMRYVHLQTEDLSVMHQKTSLLA